jgi:acid phosphatase (class A)
MIGLMKKSWLVFALVWMVGAQAQAKEVYFFGYHLPEPPNQNSDEFRQDFTTLHAYQDHRTPEECASAATQSSLSLSNGFGPKTGVLTATEVKKARVLAARVFAKAGIAVYYFKNHFKRPRPYITDNSLTPCIPKVHNSYMSYPSGHSAAGYALALALAKKFPYKKDIILQQGLKIGENRLIGGVHHPSDIIAGRKLAEQVVRGMFVSEARP